MRKMRKVLGILGILSLGMALGRLLDLAQPRAEAGGDQGTGSAKCSAQNGDVNADGIVDMSDAVTILGYMFLGTPTELVSLCAAPPAPSGLPDTGQAPCYGLVGTEWVVVPCAGATCSGQDGTYGTGCPSQGRFIENGDGTVTDACTGLMWQQDTADVNVDGQISDTDRVPWCLALDYCEGLTMAGHDDWRLPNVRELQSIVDYGRVFPSIDPVFGAFSDAYWTSTSFVDTPEVAWFVVFSEGAVVLYDGKYGGYFVRAVRG
jgi:hypothetical protein